MKLKFKQIFMLMTAVLLLVAGSADAFAEGPVSTEDMKAFSWRHIGPWNFSGRITDFAVLPGQSQIYYVATASGGLWKTEDGGISFVSLFDKYGNMSMGNVEVAPSDPNIIYLGTGEAMHARSSSHGNGMWKSTDAGKTWTHIGLEKSYYIPRLIVHPSNPDIVWVASEGQLYDNNMDSQRGLFKTEDGGETWAKVLDLKDRGVGDLIIDPTNPDVIIAAGYKTYRRAWTFIDKQPGNFLYKSTDGGATWKKLTNGLPMNIKSGWNGLTIYPKDPNIVYVRMDEEINLGINLGENRNNFRARRMFKEGAYFNKFKSFKINSALAKMVKFDTIEAKDESELADKLNEFIKDKEFQSKIGIDLVAFNKKARQVYKKDKDTLEMMDGIQKVIDLPAEEAEKKENSGRYQVINRYILHLLYTGLFQEIAPVKKNGVIYRSDDQGETWKIMTEYKFTGGSAVLNGIEAGYSGRVEVDPNNPDKLYAVEVRVMVSDDAGKTWKAAPWNGQNQAHVDTRGIWIDPLNSNHILNGNDGGVTETWDGGKNWSQKDTISAQQFYDVSVDSEFPYNVMGGTQDNGCWMGPSRNRNQYGVFPSDWTYLPSGDGYYVIRDWWNPEYIYFESQFGGSNRMNLKTGEMSRLAVRNTPEENAAGKPAQRYQWDAPIHLSPHNPGIVYVCSQHVHRSYSRGEPGTWQTISPDLSRNDPKKQAESKETNLQWATVYTFAESPVKPGVLWAGTDDGNLQMSPDGGVTWINITDQYYDSSGKVKKNPPKGAVLPYDHWVSRVEPSNHDVNVCYVTYSGYRTHSEDKTYVFKTQDMGKTWEDISGGMMNPARDIDEDPDNPNVLYLGTDYGIFVSVDQGQNWVRLHSNEPDVIIMDMDIQQRERDLAVASYGRGFYIIDIWPFKEFTDEVFAKDAYLFEPQRAVKWAMIERRGPSYGQFARSMNPPTRADFYYYLKDKADKVKVVVKDLEGNELASVTGKKEKGLHTVNWNMSQRRPAQQQGQQMRRRGGGRQVEAGYYNVTLVVNDEEVTTQKVKVIDDPILLK
ncbi:WD40/YVTN/BNR-like repeat-containing protein [Acidobacteriota bacterium]